MSIYKKVPLQAFYWDATFESYGLRVWYFQKKIIWRLTSLWERAHSHVMVGLGYNASSILVKCSIVTNLTA